MLRTFVLFTSVLVLLALGVAGGGVYIFYKFGQGLPDYRQLADYEPAVMTRVQAGDGTLLAEFATEKRVFVPISAMPKQVIQAFLSAEDKNFYMHPGIDPLGIARALVVNVKNMGSDRRPVGASTITQQVAKNFLLTSDVTVERKIKEAILAFRIERALTKNRILELYLNEIYLGYGSYGVAAAAYNYFNKSLDQLTIGEAAYLAALPKAPNNYHPLRYPQIAKGRRDYVLGRLLEDEVITQAQHDASIAEPLTIRERDEQRYVGDAEYFSEEVRRELLARYGEDQLYKGGLSVRTTLDPKLQEVASKALRDGLVIYDRRHGWRGAIAKREIRDDAWMPALQSVKAPAGLAPWRTAIVRKIHNDRVEIGVIDGSTGTIPMSELTWARKWLEGEKRGPAVKSPSDVLAVGDIVAVERVTKDSSAHGYPKDTFALRQIPSIEGSLVALDPHTGRVLAMVGGYAYERSQFNRVTQADRQPGSAFKPFVYLSALEQGYTPSTIILDAPFVIDQGPGLPKWRPGNYSNVFYGPSTMRLGIEKSRNLMTVRLAQTVGMDKVADVSHRFGVVDKLPQQLSMSLGAAETSLLRLTTGYAMFVNGGKQIRPTLIDRVQDRHGATIFRHDKRICATCEVPFWTKQPAPSLPDERKSVTDPASAYQMVSMLEGVVQRGTGARIKALAKPVAGKTGTTNDEQDTWFVGFSADLAVGVFVGFDQPRSLGPEEQGASVAAPVFLDFMKGALADKPAIPFRVPPGIRLVRVNAESGLPARTGERNVILEAFKPDNVPTDRTVAIEGYGESPTAAARPTQEPNATGTGGLY
ncbi:MAG: putative bifunctional family b-glycosyltransferase/PBP transpeptidase [Rhodospirillales bacterium]|jgi:penicillin-binding protein 1A|nr:putative bifunctional family b-glycosyltransferase/PBP transpeptidase [Rhodospirillales bacterium]